MDKIKLEELLPAGKKLTKVRLGSEMLLIYELDKYAKLLLNRSLDIKDIQFLNAVKATKHFSFAYNNGLDFGYEVDRSSLSAYDEVRDGFFTKSVEGVEFKSIVDNVFTYDFRVNTRANYILHGGNRGEAYISLVAYVLVRAYMEGIENPKLIFDHESYAHDQHEYSHMIILSKYGSRVLKDVVELRISEGTNKYYKYDPEWTAFIALYNQLGMMCRNYTMPEKYRFLKKNYDIGDVVLLYKKGKASKGRVFANLEFCYPAVIRGIEKTRLQLDYYPYGGTRLTRDVEIKNLEEQYIDSSVESLFVEADFNTFRTKHEDFDLSSIGVGGYTYTEEYFIIDVLNEDGAYQFFKDGSTLKHVWLSTPDSIYAVFEDWGVEYNKEKFLQKFFTRFCLIPTYDVYKEKAEDYSKMLHEKQGVD